MRIHPGLLLAALSSSALAAPSLAQAVVTPVNAPSFLKGSIHRRRSMPAGQAQGQRRLRSRWKAERPKRRPNRMRISKRTRRKHRRAA